MSVRSPSERRTAEPARRRPPCVAPLLAALALGLTGATAAADPGNPSESPDPGWRAMLVAGAHGLGGDEGTHAYGGFEGGVFSGRVGVKALAHYGNGNGFSSLALGGGPAFEALDLGFASLVAYAGLGWYREREEVSQVARGIMGLHGAVKVRVPVRGFVALGLTLSAWRGTLNGSELQEPISRTPYRLSVGLGM